MGRVCWTSVKSTKSRWTRSCYSPTRHYASSQKDYYEVLGVDRSADKKEVKQKYYKLAKKFHPDANPDDSAAAAKFADIQNAYACLSDDNKRAMYDQYGSEDVDMGQDPFQCMLSGLTCRESGDEERRRRMRMSCAGTLARRSECDMRCV